MIKARYAVHHLNFIEPGGTSRGVLRTKETWYLILEQDGKKGIGECGLLRGLSFDDRPDYEAKLQWLCAHIDQDPLWQKVEYFGLFSKKISPCFSPCVVGFQG